MTESTESMLLFFFSEVWFFAIVNYFPPYSFTVYIPSEVFLCDTIYMLCIQGGEKSNGFEDNDVSLNEGTVHGAD